MNLTALRIAPFALAAILSCGPADLAEARRDLAPANVTLSELFTEAVATLPPSGTLHRTMTSPEWEALMPEAYGSPYVVVEPAQALYSEITVIWPAKRRAVHLTIDD